MGTRYRFLSLSMLTKRGRESIFAVAFLLLLWLSAKMLAQGAWFPLYVSVFIGLVMIIYHSPIVTIALFLGVEIAISISVQWSYSLPWLDFGHLHFGPTDILCAIVATALAIRFAKTGLSIWFRNDLLWIFMLFTALITLGIVRGIWRYSESAIGEARPYLHFAALVLYLGTYRFSRRQRTKLFRLFVVLACILLVAGLLRAFGVIPRRMISKFKVINAAQAQFLLFVLFALIVIQITGTKRTFFTFLSSFLIFLSIVLMQHRSVWLAGVMGTAILFLIFHTRLARFALPSIALLILLMCFLFIIRPNVILPVMDSLRTSVREPFNLAGRNTAAWRLEGWIPLLKQLDSVALWTIGKGYGDYFAREVWGGVVQGNISPHSFYVTTISRLGAIGMAIFMLFTLRLERNIYLIWGESSDESVRDVMGILFACIAGSLGYMTAYGLDEYVGILFGIAVSLVIQQEENLRASLEKKEEYAKAADLCHYSCS